MRFAVLFLNFGFMIGCQGDDSTGTSDPVESPNGATGSGPAIYDTPEEAMAAVEEMQASSDLGENERYIIHVDAEGRPSLIPRDSSDTWERHPEFPLYSGYGTIYGEDLPWIFVTPAAQLSFNEMEVWNNQPTGELRSLLKLKSIQDEKGPAFTVTRASADFNFVSATVEQVTPYETRVIVDVDEAMAFDYAVAHQQTFERWNGQVNPQRLIFQGSLSFETDADIYPLVTVPYTGVFAIY